MDMLTKNPPADHTPLARSETLDRTAIRRAFRQEEAACIAERLRETQGFTRQHAAIHASAVALIKDARKRDVSGIDAFLHQYGLNTEEGIALMCLAEALLRVPDSRTADALIRDKIGDIEWAEHLGESKSTFVNAATFSLMLTGEVLERPQLNQRGMNRTLRGAMNRLGEPVIRQATLQAMRILGGQFVFGRTMTEALKRAGPERAKGMTHSFDMLGEAAMTFADAERYRQAYISAIERLEKESDGTISGSPGISVKLTALYPKYDIFHADKAIAALLPIVTELAEKARDANIHFTVDAEEADRLELSLDLVELLAANDALFIRPDGSRWEGFGMAVQAYQRRGVPLCRWLIDLAEKHDRKFMIRLVKGAYWDTEIKLTQVAGLDDFPVFTRKVATDVSFMACADVLLSAPERIYGAFATHNAYTIAAIKQRAHAGTQFEFQRLHGMGEELYAALAKAEGNAKTPVRIYAPVGGHKDLLAYLVRRLLENGANSSFVNRMADSNLSAEDLAGDPVAELAALEPKRNPAITLPKDLFPGRVNSAGIDLADPLVREPLLKRLEELRGRQWEASPTFKAEVPGEIAPITAPFDHGMRIGTRRDASAEEVEDAITRAAAIQPGWNALGGEKRALLLEAAADAFEAHTDEILSLCQLEAGKTIVDSVLELREAVGPAGRTPDRRGLFFRRRDHDRRLGWPSGGASRVEPGGEGRHHLQPRSLHRGDHAIVMRGVAAQQVGAQHQQADPAMRALQTRQQARAFRNQLIGARMINADLGIFLRRIGMSRAAPCLTLARRIPVDQRAGHGDHVVVRSGEPVLQREEIGAHILRGAGDELEDLGQAAQHLHLPRARAGARLA